MFWHVASACSLLIWLYFLFGRGGFWRVSRNIAKTGAAAPPRTIAVVIPARNEADTIGAALRSLFDQQITPKPAIILVDDGSDDGTAEIAQQAATDCGCDGQLTVITGSPLPRGWTGKLWAQAQGFTLARQFDLDYVLFTDADIAHGRESLAQLVSAAEKHHLDAVSYMAKLRCSTLPEKALIPAFVFFFFLLYPPAWVSSARNKTAGAAGGCVLLRPESLVRAGGIEAIRSAVIDDCALARLLKRNGANIWLGLTDQVKSIRSYESASEIGRMISRSAFHQLRHSNLLLVTTTLGLLLTYVLPPFALTKGGLDSLLGGGACLLMACLYIPMIRFYELSILWAVSLPAAAVFYLGATLHSALNYWTGKGGQWKGRIQDGRESAPPSPRAT